MIYDKKHTHPSNNMNRKEPVQSLYTTPQCLSANAPKQNTLAMDSSSSLSPIRFGIAASYTTAGNGSGAGSNCVGMMDIGWMTGPSFRLGLVMRIPCL
jgi:hypothetical protein